MQVTRQTRYGMLTALLIGMALLLAGCGGDNGVDQGMHDTVVAERDAAQAAQAAAEAEAAAEAQARGKRPKLLRLLPPKRRGWPQKRG